MSIPVKFYSVTKEEYEKIQQELIAAQSKKDDEKTQRELDLQGGIFFVDGTGEIAKGN